MRSNKTIFGLLLTLILMGLIRIGISNLPKNNTDVNTYVKWWQKLAPDQIHTITLSKGADRVTLVRQSDKTWKVNNEYSADTTNINSWLSKLVEANDVELVAESITQYEKLGIATTSATLNLKSGSDDKQLTVGTWNQSGRYIKLSGVDGVYLIRDLPSTLDSTDINDWIDKTIVRIDESKIKKISWNRGQQTYFLEKKDADWINAKGEKIDPASLSKLTSSLAAVSVEGVDRQIKLDNVKEDFTVTVEVEAQNPLTLQFFKLQSKILATSAAGIYTVSDQVYDAFDLKQTDFKVKP